MHSRRVGLDASYHLMHAIVDQPTTESPMKFIRLPSGFNYDRVVSETPECVIIPVKSIDLIEINKVSVPNFVEHWEVEILLTNSSRNSLYWSFEDLEEAKAFVDAYIWPQLED